MSSTRADLNIDPATMTVHQWARRVGDVIETAQECWAYAVEVPFRERFDAPVTDAIAFVTSEIDVASGRVGFGVLSPDGTTFLVEQLIDAGARHVSLRVPLNDAGAIVIRNASPGGASQFRVQSLSIRLQSHPRQYPVRVATRNVRSETVPAGGGSVVFNDDPAAAINGARMAFIRRLNLPLAGARVLDVGSGVGHFANLYASLGAQVVAVEGRAANVDEMRQRYPEIEAHIGDIQVMDLRTLGTFDVVHCFGLLYHLDSPVAALRQMEEVCSGVLLLETMVVDATHPIMVLADETFAVNQALAGLGCRPSPSFVTLALNRVGFPYVYAAASPPEHPDFTFEWRNTLDTSRDGNNLRCVFIASRTSLENPALVPLLDPDTIVVPAG